MAAARDPGCPRPPPLLLLLAMLSFCWIISIDAAKGNNGKVQARLCVDGGGPPGLCANWNPGGDTSTAVDVDTSTTSAVPSLSTTSAVPSSTTTSAEPSFSTTSVVPSSTTSAEPSSTTTSAEPSSSTSSLPVTPDLQQSETQSSWTPPMEDSPPSALSIASTTAQSLADVSASPESATPVAVLDLLSSEAPSILESAAKNSSSELSAMSVGPGSLLHGEGRWLLGMSPVRDTRLLRHLWMGFVRSRLTCATICLTRDDCFALAYNRQLRLCQMGEAPALPSELSSAPGWSLYTIVTHR